MDPTLVAAVAGFLGGRGTTVLDAVLKPAADAIGENLAARYRSWAARNVADVVNAAGEMLENAGQRPQPVPGRVLFPILEYAAVEDDPDLKRRWAALLANAAGGHFKVLPAYAEILRQLVPVQVQMLLAMSENYRENEEGYKVVSLVSREELEERFHLNSVDYARLMYDLERLNLVSGHRVEIGLDEDDTFVSLSPLTHATASPLAVGLIEACTPPPPWRI
jgi:hypothetical protein